MMLGTGGRGEEIGREVDVAVVLELWRSSLMQLPSLAPRRWRLPSLTFAPQHQHDQPAKALTKA